LGLELEHRLRGLGRGQEAAQLGVGRGQDVDLSLKQRQILQRERRAQGLVRHCAV